MHLRVSSLFLFVSALSYVKPVAAEQSCSNLGFALVEHSCFHATFGPFVGVTAVSSKSPLDSLPRLDDVHTYYEINLPEPLLQNSLSYRVAAANRAGDWVFFHDPEVYLELSDEAGNVLSPLLEQAVPDCPELPRASVFHLEDKRYRINLGPGNQARCVLVIENLSDFTARTGRDVDGDGFGSPTDTKLALCTPEPGYVTNISDCDDTRSDINSAAAEICDGIDQNCNGVADDEGLPCRSGKGACERSGVWHCNEPGKAPNCVVDAVPSPSAEQCDGVDTDCDGVDDVHETELCADSEAPRCVNVLGKVRCGCNRDAECGSEKSGLVCNEQTRTCVEGCIHVEGRNGCPDALECTSDDPIAIGECVAVKPHKTHSPNVAVETAEVSSPAGCGCRLAPSGSSSMRAFMFSALAALLVLRLRRRSLHS